MADDGRLIVKFDREDLVDVSPGDSVEMFVTGKLIDGTPFMGSDTIRVIDKGK
jgi:FKBP-type peptidyl-prolyl cis-trans isomerase